MEYSSSVPYASGIGVLLIAIILSVVPKGGYFIRRQPLRLPPGPRRLPLIGNIHQVSVDYQERTFARWATEHGDLMFARFFTRAALIINSQEIARDLLEKRGSKYSSRPRLVMMCEILGMRTNPALMRYEDAHRLKQRRWIQGTFGDKSNMKAFEMLQQREATMLVDGLMHNPNEFALYVKRYVSALIMESVYGHRVTSLEDEFILLIDRVMAAIVATGSAGGTMVDFFPLLKFIPAWLPGMAWKRHALHTRNMILESRTKPYLMARDATLSGVSAMSYVSSLVEQAARADKLEEEEDIIASANALYGAGTDTAKTAIMTFILAMVLHPDVYKRAQEHLDQVIGRNRLPTLADRESLPYVDCIVKEVYRWNPPIPLGIPHLLTEDDEYEGFDIPKDTTVIANLWSMCQREDVYSDPSSFCPERFLDQDTHDSETSDPRNIVFGHGRRLCPGRQFADSAIFLAVANMIATLNIKKARDAQGREVTPEPRFMSGFVSYPLDFVCAIEPRSPDAARLVTETVSSIT